MNITEKIDKYLNEDQKDIFEYLANLLDGDDFVKKDDSKRVIYIKNTDIAMKSVIRTLKVYKWKSSKLKHSGDNIYYVIKLKGYEDVVLYRDYENKEIWLASISVANKYL